MAQRHIYLVEGDCGEYDDYSNWIVAAYIDYDKARNHMRRANRWLKRVGAHRSQRPKNWIKLLDLENPHDPWWMTDYTGSDYRILKVPKLD